MATRASGSWRTRELSAGLGRAFGEGDATKLSLQAGWRDSRGFSATNEANTFSFDPDDDGYRNGNIGVNAHHTWRAGHAIALRLLHSDGRTDFDAGAGTADVNHQRLSSVALESDNRWSAGWRSLLRIARGADHSNTSGAFPSEFDTDQDQFSWQNDIAAFGGQAIAGIEWRREKVGGSTAFTVDERSIRSLFGGWSGSFDAHSLQASLRYDDDSQFGGNTTGNVGYGWRPSPAWLLRAGAGTAFKAPSFNDLYFPPSFGFAGNPNLEPERSRSMEVGARYDDAGWSAGATLFQNRISDLIAIDPTFTTVINVNRARIRGATLHAGYAASAWQANIEWTHQDPVDEDTGTLLVRRARNYASANAAATWGPWRGGVEWVVSGPRFDSVANTPESRMGGYGLVNLLASYPLTPELSLAARIDNVGDKRYTLAQGYNTASRAAFVTLEYSAR